MNKTYIPCIGDSVVARRKIKSKIYYNMIIGPVIQTWDNACQIITNQGTKIESDFRLYYNDWDFDFLHKTSEE